MPLAPLALLALAALPTRTDPVLKGLDPVELCAGREVAGTPVRAVQRFGHTYHFSSDANRRRFQADPERFEIQMGGGCGRMGPLSGICSSARYAVYDGRIYVFASDGCRAGFLAAPEKHLQRDDAALEGPALDRAAGRELLARVLAGLGGAERVDAATSYRWHKKGEQVDGDKRYATSESVLFRFPDEVRHESSWESSSWFDVATARDGFSGPDPIEVLHPVARREVLLQCGREPLFLVRQRGREGFDVAAEGTRKLGGVECRSLVVRFAGARTRWLVDPTSGRVLRLEWRGRLGSGAHGDVAVDCSDFRTVAGLTLPHARTVTFDGRADAERSGKIDAVEVDVELDDALFRP